MPPKKSKKTKTTPKRAGTTKKKSKRTCGRKGYIALYDANGDIRCVSKNSPDAVKQLKIMEKVYLEYIQFCLKCYQYSKNSILM